MASGLTSISQGNTHPFRDLAQLLRRNAATPNPTATAIQDFPVEAEMPDDSESNSDAADEMISRLEDRNSEVIAHEATHMAAAGAYIEGGASYTYQIGPDGKAYAIGGEVSIDMSPVPGNPRATITKMMAIRAAAMSPSDPSPQDMAVAAAAAQIEAQARTELNRMLTQNTAPTAMRAASNRYAPMASAMGGLVDAIA